MLQHLLMTLLTTDFAYLLATLAFFALAGLYLRACNRLK